MFQVAEEEEGGYSAVAVGEKIFTQGDTWEELEAMVLNATELYFQNTLEARDSLKSRLFYP